MPPSRLGGKTLLYYLSTTLLAVLVGLGMAKLIAPGIVDGQPARQLIGLDAETASVPEAVQGRGNADLLGIFLRMVPTNVVEAAARGEMLGLIFFSLLFRYFLTQVQGRGGEVLLAFW